MWIFVIFVVVWPICRMKIRDNWKGKCAIEIKPKAMNPSRINLYQYWKVHNYENSNPIALV
jgi:hypothetical protein